MQHVRKVSYVRSVFVVFLCAFALAGCGGSSSSTTPATPGVTSVRFAEGAPELETSVNGVVQPIGLNAYLQVNAQTVESTFAYGTISPFTTLTAGTLSLTVRNTEGYAVGPLKSAALSAGKQYTLVIVGSYPSYRVLTFAEPPPSSGAQLSFYEASPTVPQAGFGSFKASSKSDFTALGQANLGSVATVSLGSSVADFGGYAGSPGKVIGTITPVQLNSFDTGNALPFHSIDRLSLFLFDSNASRSPVFGSLDR